MDWLKLVLASSLVASAMNLAIQWIRDALKNKRDRAEDASMSALYLALVLERYTSECSSKVGDVSTYLHTNGQHGAYHSSLPSKPDFPDDVNWKALGVEKTARFLQFWVNVEFSNSRLEEEREIVGGEEAAESLVEFGVDLGISAFDMASEFRTSFALPDRDEYAPYEWLTGTRDELATARAVRIATIQR